MIGFSQKAANDKTIKAILRTCEMYVSDTQQQSNTEYWTNVFFVNGRFYSTEEIVRHPNMAPSCYEIKNQLPINFPSGFTKSSVQS